ncbi:Uncharacterised protein [Mycobacteroides abscessus subsp. massiliense]|uniref:Uncharacterized protein n=1 Tax=Mycobacteroides abscessus subsp. massiliense TaxID=1962118 RepID=A0A1T8KZI9_9MYCO|nr:Uncharacterised protein [Mycobacteroides abscessus subsp. massiliense]SKM41809.1 Uncharacterised protein [Mycobacteroides abscessus subsp. massiliense]
MPRALKPAAVCNDTGSAAGGTTAPITGAAAAWAAARRAVSASTAALVAIRPSGTTLRFIVGTPFPEQHAH